MIPSSISSEEAWRILRDERLAFTYSFGDGKFFLSLWTKRGLTKLKNNPCPSRGDVMHAVVSGISRDRLALVEYLNQLTGNSNSLQGLLRIEPNCEEVKVIREHIVGRMQHYDPTHYFL